MTVLVVLVWLAYVLFTAAALYGAARAAVRRCTGRHSPARDTATLPDLMKEH